MILFKEKRVPAARPVLLAIMDGLGLGHGDAGDAVKRAHTPNLDALMRGHLSRTLCAHGRAVGMPQDQDMGNSEVGHNALGAGRIFDQGASRVADAFKTRALLSSDTWHEIVGPRVFFQRTLHLLGLLSDGNVHSHIDHLLALIESADAANLQRVRVHAILDGRDVAPRSALRFIRQLEATLHVKRLRGRDYAIASGGGRMQITMDRYHADWSMVERGYQLHVHGQGRQFRSAAEAVGILRQENPTATDQDLPGFVIKSADLKTNDPMASGDAVVLFNFRGDRMLEMTSALEDDSFVPFDRGVRPQLFVAGMTQYDAEAKRPERFLVAPPQIPSPLGEVLAARKIKQFACSETQKFGHVTYFFNGNRGQMFDSQRETYLEIPSLAPPFDAHPEMQAALIVAATEKALIENQYGFLRINLPNADMVAHTGNLPATVEAVACVDRSVGQLMSLCKAHGAILCLTADHGNAEEMYQLDPKTHGLLRDGAGAPQAKTSHTLNPVPFALWFPGQEADRWMLSHLPHAGLDNVARTIALLLGVQVPESYSPALIQKVSTAVSM